MKLAAAAAYRLRDASFRDVLVAAALDRTLLAIWNCLESLVSHPVLLTVFGYHDLARPPAGDPRLAEFARWPADPANSSLRDRTQRRLADAGITAVTSTSAPTPAPTPPSTGSTAA